MCKYSGFLFLSLCYILAVKVSRAESLDYIDTQNTENYKQEVIISETTENLIETKLRDFESSLNKKLNLIKTEIIGTLLYAIDVKIPDMQNEHQNFKKTYNSDDFNSKFEELEVKINELETTINENGRKLDLLTRATADYSNNQDSMKNVLLDNAKLVNETLEQCSINNIQVYNTNNTDSLLLNTSIINSSKMNEVKNATASCLTQLNETRIHQIHTTNWSECKEVVKENTFKLYDFSKPLLPMSESELNKASLCKNGDRTEYLHMRVGVRADIYAAIILSPEREPKDQGFFFKISIYKKHTSLYSFEAGRMDNLKVVQITTNLSYTYPTLIDIKLSNGTLELRHDTNTSSPVLAHHDDRFSSVNYFAFDSFGNSMGNATFLYNC